MGWGIGGLKSCTGSWRSTLGTVNRYNSFITKTVVNTEKGLIKSLMMLHMKTLKLIKKIIDNG